MRVVRYSDGERFVRRVVTHLVADEVENNLILSVIEGVRAGIYDDARMMTVEGGRRVQLGRGHDPALQAGAVES